MGDLKTCVEDTLGTKFSEAERGKLIKTVQEIKNKRALKKRISDRQEAALVAMRNVYLDTNAKWEMVQFVQNNFPEDYAGGFQAIIEGSLVAREGARESIDASVGARKAMAAQRLDAEVSSEGLRDVLLSGEFDDEIMRAIYSLNRAKPDLDAVKKLPNEAVKLAEIIIKHVEGLRLEHNRVGGFIPHLDGRITSRAHDDIKIKDAGKKEWLDFIRPMIDWDNTMPDLSVDLREAELGKIYERISNNLQSISQEGYSPGAAIDARGRLKKSRVLHFKNIDDEIAYNARFGRDTLIETVVREMDALARDTAIMERLGPSAMRNIRSVVAELNKGLVSAGKGDKAKELTNLFHKIEDTSLPVITEEINIPQNKTAAKWGAVGRSFIVTSKLGSSILSQIADLGFYGSVMRYVGAGGTHRFPFSGVLEGLGNVLGNLGKLTPEMRQVASELSIEVDGLIPSVTKFDADTNRPGGITRHLNKAYKWYGISGWQDRTRLLAAVTASHRYANQTANAWDSLPVEMKNYFSQHGITAGEWDAIRTAKKSADWEGRELLTVDSVEAIDANVFGGADKKAEAVRKYSALVSEVARLAASEPNAKVRGRMLSGTRPGSLSGETMRFFWQFKSVLQTILYEHYGRAFHGHHGERVSNYQAFKRMFTDPRGGASDLAALMATGTILGYLSITLKDLARLRQPEQPEEWQGMVGLMGRAMAQGGVGGIYADILIGHAREYYGEGPLSGFLGPGFGTISDIASLYIAMRNGDPLGAKALKILLDNIPGQNFVLTRMVTDHLFMYRLKEMLDPGYLNRLEKRVRERGQEFWLAPTDTVPYGGGL